MSRNLGEYFVPFPPQLMSSALAPSVMPLQYAREIRNMFALQDGAGTKRNGCVEITPALASDLIITRLLPHVTTAGVQQILAVTDDGAIHLRNISGWAQVYSGLSPDGVVRFTAFNGKLILCNGLNQPLVWDGSAMTEISAHVQDLGANLTYVSGTQFTIESDASLYVVGASIRCRNGAGSFVTSTISSVSGTGTLTVTLVNSVLTSSLDEVYVTLQPPKFQFMYTAHDRLWGIGTGAISATEFSNSVDRTRVYYTHTVNDETAWYDSAATLQSLNLADKFTQADELLGMAVKDGLTIFCGRQQSQVWTGYDPSASGDFAWQKTLPVGVIHADLMTELPNDIGFFTPNGARTLSRTLQTEQLDIGDFGADMDPSLQAAIRTLQIDADAYRAAQAFRYIPQGWFGFKVGGQSFIYQLRGRGQGWTIFDGLFGSATACMNTPDGKLYLAKENKLYQYDESIYSDAGATITTRWWTPWLSFSQNFKRWANKFYEVITENHGAQDMTVKRYKNYNSANYVQTSAAASVDADYWDAGDWDQGFWDNIAPRPDRTRDPFVADTFSYALETASITGPFTVFGLKLYGVTER